MTIGGKTAASFDFDLAARAVTRLVTSGAGDVKVGWCRVSTDKPISGASIFHVFDAQGKALAEVGVNSADLMTKFNLIADSIGFFDTGIAVANPSETSNTTYINFNLYDKEGTWVAGRKESMILESSKHQALFMTQLFPDYAKVGEFEGTIQVSSSVPIAALTLRSIDEKLTSVPVLPQVHGFAPDTGVELAQYLAGTSTAMRWKLHLNSNDLAIDSMKVAVPGLKLQASGIKKGAEIGFGTLLLGDSLDDSGLMKLVVTNTDPFEFQALANFSVLQAYKLGAFELFTGKMSSSSSGGLIIDISKVSVGNAQWNGGTRTDLDFSFRPDPVLSQASAGTSSATIEYVSSSGKADYSEPKALRSSTQPMTLVAPDAAIAKITAIWPLFPSTGSLLTITGSNFGSKPMVVFPLDIGSTLTVPAVPVDAGSLTVNVPEGMVEGSILVNNGSGLGNGYTSPLLYGPVKNLSVSGTTPGSEVPFTLKIDQKALQLPTISFDLNFYNVDRSLTGLTTGAVVGTFKLIKDYGYYQYNDWDYELRVGSSSADKVELFIAYKNDPRDWGKGKITVTRLPGTGTGLKFAYAPGTFPKTPSLLLYPTQIEVAFTGFPIKLPSSSDLSTGLAARVQSGPADLGGMSTAITVNIMK